jgi:hypothetical protein
MLGTYGENSFTSSHPSEEQIFLEETWVLNKEGRFERLRESTKGSCMIGLFMRVKTVRGRLVV